MLAHRLSNETCHGGKIWGALPPHRRIGVRGLLLVLQRSDNRHLGPDNRAGRPDDLLRFRHGTHPGRREELTDRATQSPNAWTDLFALARAVLALDQANWQKICSTGNRVHSR